MFNNMLVNVDVLVFDHCIKLEQSGGCRGNSVPVDYSVWISLFVGVLAIDHCVELRKK